MYDEKSELFILRIDRVDERTRRLLNIVIFTKCLIAKF